MASTLHKWKHSPKLLCPIAANTRAATSATRKAAQAVQSQFYVALKTSVTKPTKRCTMPERKQSRSFDGSRFFSARSPSEIESLQMKRYNCDLDLQLRTCAHIKIPALLALEVILFSQDVFTTKHQRIISYRKTAQRHRHIQHRFTACWLHMPRATRQRA